LPALVSGVRPVRWLPLIHGVTDILSTACGNHA
jgi:hypothetical protein